MIKRTEKGQKKTVLQRMTLWALTLMTASASFADVTLTGTYIASSGEDPANAFDSNYATYYASNGATRKYVGLDLGKPHIISRIGYSPRQGYQERMKLGIFEGANSPDFCDAVPLGIVANVPADNNMAFIPTKCSRAFRYVRYVSPNGMNCNVSELRFIGHEAKEGEGDDSRFPTLTGLPVINIHTLGNAEINSLTEWRDGIVTMTWDGGNSFLQDSMRIRGRGNASWGFPKKPYRLKLNHKAHALGMRAKAKDWTLINNYGDKTLIRNMVAFDFAERLGMDWTSQARLVDVVVNGEYEGTYQFCDQIEVHKKRVEVAEVDDTETPGDPVTGGFLLEIDNNYTKEAVHFSSKVLGMPMVVHYPDDDEITPEQLAYIKDHLAKFETAIRQKVPLDPETGYPNYMDVNSFMKLFIVGELSANTDAFHSVYLFKERGDDHFVFGPVWDFDIALDNDSRTHTFLLKNYKQNQTWLFQSGTATLAPGTNSIAARVLKYSPEVLVEEWSRARYDGGLTPENSCALVDSLALSMKKSQELNFTRWPTLKSVVHMNYTARGTFEKEIDYLKKFITNRFAWMDQKIGFDLKYTDVSSSPVTPEGVISVGVGTARLEGFPAGSVVMISDLTGRMQPSIVVEEFFTEVTLPADICIITVRQPDGSVHTFKVASAH